MTLAAIPRSFIADEADGTYRLQVMVEGMHCPSCVAIIENGLKKRPEVTYARLNLSTRRLTLQWRGAVEQAETLVEAINAMGYHAMPFDPATRQSGEQNEQKFLLRCLAVSGFASANMMIFSVPLWIETRASLGAGTTDFFRWILAAIAIPTVAYAGRPFFRSAWSALREMHTNMDVPISVAIILAVLMSLFETATHGMHAYFDSAVMLIFFLLIGRYLEARARGKARSAAHDLMQMMEGTAQRITEAGTLEPVAFSQLAEGMILQVAAGEKFGADGEIIDGISEIDTSMITGETLPQSVAAGSRVFAGMLNRSAPLRVRVTRAGEKSLLAEIVRLMETAEQSQARYVTLADQISRWYTPVVHALAAITFAGWLIWRPDTPWQESLLYAATVLIITCPCALGLAVPAVQVVASGRLMRGGILLKSGSALERLSAMTHAVFDKTGTLTLGKPVLAPSETLTPEQWQLAASMASQSRHPLSQAVAQAYAARGDAAGLLPLSVEEVAGCGLQAQWQGKTVRLGRAEWAVPNLLARPAVADAVQELWLAVEGAAPHRFTFTDALRADAVGVVAALKQAGIGLSLYSGDRAEVVRDVAQTLGIEDARAGLLPDQKAAALAELRAKGAKVLMVGDGLNDAPCLASADISMSPASAMDISQNAADIVFQGDRLTPILTAWKTARVAQQLVRQNFALSMVYNVIAVPAAMAGYVTPLLAAVAMSGSSIVVIANALRLPMRTRT